MIMTCFIFLYHQCRRVYEILRLQVTDRSNSEQYYKFRVFVKNRLNGPYHINIHTCTCTSIYKIMNHITHGVDRS